MKGFIRLFLGFFLFVFFVFNPLRAKLIAAVASMMPPTNASTVNLLIYAHSFEPCNVSILITCGDLAAKQRNASVAVWAYGQAMLCSPGNALFRMKYGESLLMGGFNGLFAIKEAVLLEPHNPVFRGEFYRISALHLPAF